MFFYLGEEISKRLSLGFGPKKTPIYDDHCIWYAPYPPSYNL